MSPLSYLLLLPLLLVAAFAGALVGAETGARRGAVDGVCKTIDAIVGQSLMTQDQANLLAKALMSDLGLREDDLRGDPLLKDPPPSDVADEIARIRAQPGKTPCSVALDAL